MKNITFFSIRLIFLTVLCAAAAVANTVSLDPTFNGTGYRIQTIVPPPGVAFAASMARQADGKIVIAGNSPEVNQSPSKVAVMRLNSDGTLDASFGTGGIVLMDFAALVEITKVVILPDGKILLGGTASAQATATDFLLIRFNADGSLDTSFNSTGYAVQSVNGFSIDYLKDFALQPDGKIVAVGKSFVLPQTALPYDFAVIRFNANGALDTTFNGTGILTVGTPNVDETAEAVVVQPDGKILVGGLRSTDNALGNFLLMRRHADGTPDTSFGSGGTVTTVAGSQYHYIKKIALQSDGKIIAGGYNYLVRYTPNGARDESFAFNAVISVGEIGGIKVLADDRFLLAPRVGVRPSRYLKDGALDTNFAAGEFIPGQLCFQRGIDVEPDGKIVMGGHCSSTGDDIARFAAFRLEEKQTKRWLDFNGDSATDLSLFRPSTGQWLYSSSFDNQINSAAFGTATDRPIPADFTGDGRTDFAVFRPSTGEWFVLRSENGTFYSFPFGAGGDVPVADDYDGDQIADAAVFRPATGEWFIRKSTGGTLITRFGAAGDLPVPSDFDGDFKTDIAIYRPSAGEWWIQKSSDDAVYAFQFGTPTDKPVAGDYTGDNKTDAAFWRPSTGEWFILRSEDSSYYSIPFGTNGDLPTPGNYAGDDRFDLVVYRPSTNTWHVQATGGVYFSRIFGAPGDQPLPNLFVP